jgi:hypothetical protein
MPWDARPAVTMCPIGAHMCHRAWQGQSGTSGASELATNSGKLRGALGFVSKSSEHVLLRPSARQNAPLAELNGDAQKWPRCSTVILLGWAWVSSDSFTFDSLTYCANIVVLHSLALGRATSTHTYKTSTFECQPQAHPRFPRPATGHSVTGPCVSQRAIRPSLVFTAAPLNRRSQRPKRSIRVGLRGGLG